MKNHYKCILIVLMLATTGVQAGLLDKIFPKRKTGERLNFTNFSDADYPGYCYGISRIETEFSGKTIVQQFNRRARKDSPYEVERKIRATLNGERPTFNGYANLHDMSQAHEGLMKRLVKEVSLSQGKFNKKSNKDPAEIKESMKKVEESGKNPQIMQDLLFSKPHRISFCGNTKMADGRFPCHSVKAVSAKIYGQGKYEVKIQDPNYPGTRKMHFSMAPNGGLKAIGKYNEWGVLDGGAGIVLFVGFDALSDDKRKIMRGNRYTKLEDSSAPEPRTRPRGHR